MVLGQALARSECKEVYAYVLYHLVASSVCVDAPDAPRIDSADGTSGTSDGTSGDGDGTSGDTPPIGLQLDLTLSNVIEPCFPDMFRTKLVRYKILPETVLTDEEKDEGGTRKRLGQDGISKVEEGKLGN